VIMMTATSTQKLDSLRRLTRDYKGLCEFFQACNNELIQKAEDKLRELEEDYKELKIHRASRRWNSWLMLKARDIITLSKNSNTI